MIQLVLNGEPIKAEENELLIDAIKRTGSLIPHRCYHAQLGPIQTCDTCMVEVNGTVIRACATRVAEGMRVSSDSVRAAAAQAEALSHSTIINRNRFSNRSPFSHARSGFCSAPNNFASHGRVSGGAFNHGGMTRTHSFAGRGGSGGAHAGGFHGGGGRR